MKPNLFILSNGFPNSSAKSEDWLLDELNITSSFYNKISIFPDSYSGSFHTLPANCEVINISANESIKLNLKERYSNLKIVFSDFLNYPDKKDFLQSLRYNIALVKNLHLKAKKIVAVKNGAIQKTILYAYWADNLATTACIIKQLYLPESTIVTRGHGFEIFEEQTKFNLIPFRTFQLKYIARIFADSKKGTNHLIEKHPSKKNSISYSYVGTKDCGIGQFDSTSIFSIVTCSYIRSVKRLHLMADILKYIDFNLVWHVLGNGEDLDTLKKKNSVLPSNVTVIYHGYMANDEILSFYKNTSLNLFVSLSYSEGLPVTMMEAQSFGIPIMSTDVGGCSEICNIETGFLIEKDFDPKDVATKIEEFKNSEKNTKKFRETIREFWCKNFDAKSNYIHFAKEVVAISESC